MNWKLSIPGHAQYSLRTIHINICNPHTQFLPLMQKSFLVGIGTIVYLLTLFVVPSEVLAAQEDFITMPG